MAWLPYTASYLLYFAQMHLLRILVAHYRLNLTGFTSAHNKVHEAAITLAEEIRLKMEQLPTSSNPSSLTSNECLVANACYHVVPIKSFSFLSN
jgi:hypothetical protein